MYLKISVSLFWTLLSILMIQIHGIRLKIGIMITWPTKAQETLLNQIVIFQVSILNSVYTKIIWNWFYSGNMKCHQLNTLKASINSMTPISCTSTRNMVWLQIRLNKIFNTAFFLLILIKQFYQMLWLSLALLDSLLLILLKSITHTVFSVLMIRQSLALL